MAKLTEWDDYMDRFCTCRNLTKHKFHCGRIYRGAAALEIPYHSALRWDRGAHVGPAYQMILRAKGIKPPKR